MHVGLLINLRRVWNERKNVGLSQLSREDLELGKTRSFFRRMHRASGDCHPRSGSNLTPANAFVMTLPLMGSAG